MVRFTPPPLARLVTLALNARVHHDGIPPTAVGMARGGEPIIPGDPVSIMGGPTTVTPALSSAFDEEFKRQSTRRSTRARLRSFFKSLTGGKAEDMRSDTSDGVPEVVAKERKAESNVEDGLMAPPSTLTPALESTLRQRSAKKDKGHSDELEQLSAAIGPTPTSKVIGQEKENRNDIGEEASEVPAALTPALEGTLQRALAASRKENLQGLDKVLNRLLTLYAPNAVTGQTSMEDDLRRARELTNEWKELTLLIASYMSDSSPSTLTPQLARTLQRALDMANKGKSEAFDHAMRRFLCMSLSSNPEAANEAVPENVPGPMEPIEEYAGSRAPYVMPIVGKAVGGEQAVSNAERAVAGGMEIVVVLGATRGAESAEDVQRTAVAENINAAIIQVLTSSDPIREKFESGEVEVCGAAYDVQTGRVTFLSADPLRKALEGK